MNATSTTVDPNAHREVWTVTRLNLEVRAMLESGFGSLWVEGEISNLAQPRSGHIYFSLKDRQCQVRCAMFRGQNRRLQFIPENGQQVLLRGRVGLYAERGDYQMVVDYMEEGGIGALRRAFDALKDKLAAEGMFAAERKRALPPHPASVGILTSPTGAALRDVLSTLARRMPGLPVVVYPVPVQGTEAPDAIAAMLQTIGERAECDVLIVARGGGSLEDLWAFNDERTARALAGCPIPIVSGVGHETDFTIADFVADYRAATPTAAAEAVSQDAEALRLRIGGMRERLRRAVGHDLRTRVQQLDGLRRRVRHPSLRLQELSQRTDLLALRLQRALETRLSVCARRLETVTARLARQHPALRLAALRRQSEAARDALHKAVGTALERRRAQLRLLNRALATLGPAPTLARGYALVTQADDGRLISYVTHTAAGAVLRVRLQDGELTCTVNDVSMGKPADR
ncbi:MAG: exodeoxyribonuclease VII large subunit [Pseudomonadota bacterium]